MSWNTAARLALVPRLYSVGLINPTVPLPLATDCWLASAKRPAQRGAAKLVPPKPVTNFPLTTVGLSKFASAATSGELRRVVDPIFAELTPPGSCCHAGIAVSSTKPPPLWTQAVSPDQAPPGPAVVKSVPPT